MNLAIDIERSTIDSAISFLFVLFINRSFRDYVCTKEKAESCETALCSFSGTFLFAYSLSSITQTNLMLSNFRYPVFSLLSTTYPSSRSEICSLALSSIN